MASHQLEIALDEERVGKLTQLAARLDVDEGTLARSLLSSAIDDADLDADSFARVLDGIDGAWERAQLGRRQARTGEIVALEEL